MAIESLLRASPYYLRIVRALNVAFRIVHLRRGLLVHDDKTKTFSSTMLVLDGDDSGSDDPNSGHDDERDTSPDEQVPGWEKKEGGAFPDEEQLVEQEVAESYDGIDQEKRLDWVRKLGATGTCLCTTASPL